MTIITPYLLCRVIYFSYRVISWRKKHIFVCFHGGFDILCTGIYWDNFRVISKLSFLSHRKYLLEKFSNFFFFKSVEYFIYSIANLCNIGKFRRIFYKGINKRKVSEKNSLHWFMQSKASNITSKILWKAWWASNQNWREKNFSF